MHPFLAEDFQVRWSTLVPQAVEADIRAALADARGKVEAICGVKPEEATYERTFAALDEANELLERGWGRLNHLDSVCDEPAQRAALNAMLPEVSEYYASIPLNERLWAVLKSYGESAAVAGLGEVERRYVEETLSDFRESGADLAADKKARVAEIEAELSMITKKYAEHVLDATNAWEKVVEDEALLEGLPASAKAGALANARSKGMGTEEKPVWRFTLQMPSMMPVMQHAKNDELRREFWEASVRVASEGEYDNTELVGRILALRQEKAEILGYGNFADLTLKRRMARSGEVALKFIEDLHDRVEGAYRRDYEELCAYKGRKTGEEVDGMQPWEVAYWSERRRQEEYDFDDEALRPYFPVDRVMAGMFELCSLLFGIRIVERETCYYERGCGPASLPEGKVEVWHPEVKFYDLFDEKSEELLGSFYADWHPRESKRGGAWMNSLQTGGPAAGGRVPHLGLIVGNMSPPVDGKPALLTHSEVETIFHEFGHLLHGLLSEVPVRSLAGTNVPWDFVELPSQIMENFCWDRRSLDFFARHFESGEVIPEGLYERMIAAKNYMSATAFMRQLSFGKLDLELHLHPGRWVAMDLDEADRQILERYRVRLKTESPSMARRFNHLFSSPTGYAAGYYSYKWAEVLDADAFTKFQEGGVLDPVSGHAFREHILSKGNSLPVDESFRRFMGRDPQLEAILERSGLLEERVS